MSAFCVFIVAFVLWSLMFNLKYLIVSFRISNDIWTFSIYIFLFITITYVWSSTLHFSH